MPQVILTLLRGAQGWRVGVATSAIIASIAFLVNLSLTLWAGLRFRVVSGIGDAYVGDCGVVDTWTLWLHILINILGSALLGASN